MKWRYLTDEEKVSLLKEKIQGRRVKKVYLDTSTGIDLLVLEFDNGYKLTATDGEYGDLRSISILYNNRKLVMLLDNEEHPVSRTFYDIVHNNPGIQYINY